MSTVTPTTQELSENIIAQLEASLNQSIPLLPKSFTRVLSKSLAGVFILLYKYIGFGILQIFVSTASAQRTEINGRQLVPLTEWGLLIGVGEPARATRAELQISVTVTSQVGTLASGAQLIGTLNGVTYVTTSAINLDAPIKTVIVRAVGDQSGGTGAGAIGNLQPDDLMTFVNAQSNVGNTATVITQTITGANGESTEAYRQRILDRFQNRPQGGALADYQIWGEEPVGIINIYPYTSVCPGQVDVYAEATVASSGNADGVPTNAQLQAVQDSIEFDVNGLATRRPAGALVNSLPISRTAFDVEVINLTVDDLASVQALISAALIDYMFDRAPFIDGLTVFPRKDRVTQGAIAGIVEAIASSAGGTVSTVVLKEGGVPTVTYTLGIGEKAKLGVITYI